MRGQIEREVERRDEAARTDWHAFPHPHIAFCPGRNVERLDLAIVAHGFFGGNPECVDQARGFAFRILDRLARFNAQRIGQLVKPLLEAVDAMLQHVLPFVARHRCHWSGGSDRSGYRFFDDIGRRKSGPESDLVGIFVGDFQVGIGLHRFVVEIERIDVF